MRALIAIAIVLVSAALPAAAARESFTGIYNCGASSSEGGSGAYSSRVTMVVENGEAHITRESAAIKESLSGRVAADGTVKLEGTGARKEGATGWLYRFEGRIDGNRFEARGQMLSPNLTTRLRECSLSLTRVRASEPPLALEPSVKLSPPAEMKAVRTAATETSATPRVEAPAPKARDGAADSLERQLDFAGKSETATMEGTVSRGTPHRYLIDARRGQTLNAALKSDGARFDVYDPGSTLTLLSGGFVVQGTRVGASNDGDRLDIELPADGKYLLLVRANGDRAFYTLELKVEQPAQTALEKWLHDERVWIGAAIFIVAIVLFSLMRRKRERRLFRSD